MGALNDNGMTPLTKRKVHDRVYRWTAEQANGGCIVDIGCGDAVGTAHLLPCASHLISLDLDPAALSAVPQEESLPVLAECGSLPIANGQVDTAVAIALLEYLQDPVPMLVEAKRVLREGGCFICATKHLQLSIKLGGARSIYDNHAVEYTADTLYELLTSFFQSVTLYGLHLNDRASRFYMDQRARTVEKVLVRMGIKHMFPRGLRKALRKKLTGVDVDVLSSDDFQIDSRTSGAYYLIAVCR